MPMMKISPVARSFFKLSAKYSCSTFHPLSNSCNFVHPSAANDLFPKRTYYNDISEEVKDAVGVTSSRIKDFFSNQKIDYKQGFTSLVVSGCKQCRNSCANAKADQAKLYINTTTGGVVCAQCLWSANWQKFERTVEAAKKNEDVEKEEPIKRKKGEPKRAEITDGYLAAKEEATLTGRVSTLSDEEYANLLSTHEIQGLEKKTFDKFGVRVYANKLDLFLPRYQVDKKKACGFKKITVRQLPEQTVITEQHFPRETGHFLGLFGWDLISAEAKEVILCSNDFDAMIVQQALKKPVISLPKGISVLPVECLPMLEQFEKVVLWLSGPGNRGWQSTKIFARKLIEARCLLVSPEIAQASPMALFKAGGNLSSVIQKAQPVTHKSIITFGSFRQEVFNELNNVEESCGLKWKRFPLMSGILKGHRKGEMTIFTGPTGAGKTTFLSEYSLDLCSQGLRTLWGSFEIRNARLAKTMLNQFSRISLQKNVAEFDARADRFELLPLYFLVFYGQQSMENVLDAMKHAVYVRDIEHVVVDNLQFMMGSSNFRSLTDRIVHQDQLIEGFRRFASENDCHVTVVMHPRKELEAVPLTAQSIYGGVKASQEADNILILQNNQGKSGLLQGRRYIEVVKNRFDGELGMMPLYYDKETQSYVKKEKTHPHYPRKSDSPLSKTTLKENLEMEKSLEEKALQDQVDRE